MNAKCINTGRYRLTEGNDYEVIKSERGYIFVENDGGVVAKYDRRFFEVEEEAAPARRTRREPVTPPPPPPRTVADVIASIVIDATNLTFTDINMENKVVENPFSYSDTNISCGAGQVAGINGLCSRINICFNRQEDDFLEEKKAILRRCIQEWVLNKTTKAVWMISTAINQIDGDYVLVLDEMSGSRSDVKRNPNSGNDIKIWLFYPEIEINDDEDEEDEDDHDDRDWDDEDDD